MLYYQKRDANGLQICFLIPNLKEDYADYNHGEHVFFPDQQGQDGAVG